MPTFFTNNSSYNGHGFWTQYENGLSPALGDVVLAETDHHIPGSNDNVTNSTGRRSRNTEVSIRCTAAELTALQGDVDGSTHSLVLPTGTVTALLLGVVQARKEVGADIYQAVLRVRY